MNPDLRCPDDFRGTTQRGFDQARAATRAEFQDCRRHFDVAFGRIDVSLGLVLERLSALSARLDRMEENLREEIRRSHRELAALIRFPGSELDGR